ncbi:MAG: hypothetical protein GY801_04055 [bacterium]|nr:hypothetical protein [bacterium]
MKTLFSALVGFGTILLLNLSIYAQTPFQAKLIRGQSCRTESVFEIGSTGDIDQLIEEIYARIEQLEPSLESIPLQTGLTLDEFDRIMKARGISTKYYEIQPPSPGSGTRTPDKPGGATKVKISYHDIVSGKEYHVRGRKAELWGSIDFTLTENSRGEEIVEFYTQKPRIDLRPDDSTTPFITFFIDLRDSSLPPSEQTDLKRRIGTGLAAKHYQLVWSNNVSWETPEFENCDEAASYIKRHNDGARRELNSPMQSTPQFYDLRYLLQISQDGAETLSP